MFQELSTSIKANLYERISSPLVGAIALSWIGFNWKALFYFLFSETKIEAKIAYFEQNYADPYNNLLFPFVVGSCIAIFYPVIAVIPFYISEYAQSYQRSLKKRLSQTELLTVQQSLALRAELAQKDTRLREVIQENQKVSTELEEKIKELRKENSELYYKLSEIEPVSETPKLTEINLSIVEEKILKLHIGMKKGYSQYLSGLAHELELPDAEIQSSIENLLSLGLIKNSGTVEDENGSDVAGYNLSGSGRKYLAMKKFN